MKRFANYLIICLCFPVLLSPFGLLRHRTSRYDCLMCQQARLPELQTWAFDHPCAWRKGSLKENDSNARHRTSFEESPSLWTPGRATFVAGFWLWNHGGVMLVVDAWLKNSGGGIMCWFMPGESWTWSHGCGSIAIEFCRPSTITIWPGPLSMAHTRTNANKP